MRPEQNGSHFPDDIFNWIFLNENASVSIKISLKFVPKGPITNIPVLFQIMAWHRPGDKPLFEPMMVSSLTHVYVTRPQWVNTISPQQNVQNFAEDFCIFQKEHMYTLILISLNLILNGSIWFKSISHFLNQ